MARTTIATRWIAAGSMAGVAVFAGLAAVSTDHASSEPTTPVVTDAPPVDHQPVASTPVSTTVPATARATAPATAPATIPAPTDAVTVAPTAPATVAPAQQAPASVPRSRHRTPTATSGSS